MLFESVLAALAAVALVFVGAVAFKKYGKDDDEPDGATASHAGAMLSALFLLIFAIAIIVPWTAADDARKNTYAEAQSLTEAYWGAKDLPGPAAQQTRTAIADYMHYVVSTEWPYMARHSRITDAGWAKLDTLRNQLGALDLKTDDLKSARDDVVSNLKDVYADRRQRGFDAGSGLPTGVLLFTVLTGIVMILFPFLAGARPRGMTWVPLVVMSALLGISVYLVFDINHVFSGALSVGPEAFDTALQEFARIG
jgi:hypothetical protein